jgi:integrase
VKPLQVYAGMRLHDLRHLALQLALDGGAMLNDVQSLARHADPAMTMRYLKRSGSRRAADAIGRSLLPPKEA